MNQTCPQQFPKDLSSFVSPLRLGSLVVGFPVIQAALSGYSDPPMRMLARRFGAEFTMSEVLLDQFVVSVSRRKSRLYFADKNEHPCGAQIMGGESDLICRAVERLLESGFDLIDLNFACPVKKVLSRQRGGWLLNNPDNATKIIEQVSRLLNGKIPLTIKLRKGYDNTTQSRNHFFNILNNAANHGICGITLHGRTVQQQYTGQNDWDFVREVKEYLVQSGNSQVAVIGSGDLFDAETVLRRFRDSGVDGLALARGAIGNPWLFRDVKSLMLAGTLPNPPDLSEQKTVLREHFELASELYGESRAPTTMRAFAVYYSKLHPNMTNVRADFVRVKNAKDWDNVLEKWY
ncbi:MAG: tRNA-dihydrouridine synthase family protein [Planctomycetaceae bacterium]|jgi:nifR3 family TIM-barrel protein|nr:tRNA-dihydrouridine synthase family protein [Planctomycetaceae bacterium]